MKKRLLALALALIMVVGVLPMSASAASITESQVQTKLNELKSGKYKPGEKYTGSGECLGFAVDVFNAVFGTSLPHQNYPKARFSNTTGLKEVGHLDSNYTSDDLANLLKKAKPGDMLLIADPGKSYGHAMIIWSVSSSGQPTVYDANSSSANKLYNISSNAIDIHSYSTKTASQYHSDAATLYRYKDYVDGSSATTPAKTTITFSSLSVPGSLTEGTDAMLDGSFTATNSKINSVKAEVINSATNSVALSAYTGGNFSVWTYGPLTNSKLNTDLDLGKLKPGTYYVKYTVTTQDGTTASKTTSNFTVQAKVVNCTTHTKGAFQFYENLHPHYNYWKCSVCGQDFTDNSTTKVDSCATCNPPRPNCDNGHTWGSWRTVKEATCEKAGSQERECSVCGETDTQRIDALEHDYQVGRETDTYIRYTCSNCGDSYTVEKEANCDNGHTWGDWDGYDPTCGSDGWRYRFCEVCGKKDAEDLPATGKHYYVYDSETTYSIYYVCRNCGDLKLEEKEPTVVDNSGMVNFVAKNRYSDGLFRDVKSNDWFSSNVATAYSMGLMNGTGGNSFSPGNNMTLAEVVTLAARIHSIYYNGSEKFATYDGGNWYDPYVNYARDNGIIDANYAYSRPATREEVVHILARALPEDELAYTAGRVTFADSREVTYMADVQLLSGAGVINGIQESGLTYFKPLSPITRAEVAAVVGRMVQPSTRVGK